ncbi:signal peptidase I [Metabacillus fastidiosus]|uniref:Signal peptidase I n=1 Tax=Metabacillus fastidiosus TaxID=1458 RepID=A0ABU6NWZ2_9BACI|nr:signal peptidase I [Metabacillus fastidiosus]MEC2076999.1 signal peptidase I [Metabacillus fastidiosus]MED4401551.1 signal peptidase I [Metabacillus fastidiosus]MED4452880.1 signal peptidase I [Metabacillus fastidiosus]MED4463186.1 signal peptidase I [Metabacillus fastidiosus]MED4532536.1 signal peptidase I [Metabacillus fastidiosus]
MTEKKKRNEFLDWVIALGIAFLVVGAIRYLFFTPIIVDGESMMPTLHTQDRMIVNKLGYKIGEPERFDIVVFHATEEKDYIKRVIGLPGDHVEYKDDTLYINGKKYDEPYLDEYKKELLDGPLTESFTLEERTGKTTVPEGEIFVMGDNRRYSKDSRQIGTVPIDEVMGKTSFVFWPLSDVRFVK